MLYLPNITFKWTLPPAATSDYFPAKQKHLAELGKEGIALCFNRKMPPALTHLSFLGIEDTFRTAATEVSLLAGSEDFNATKLFEVGKQPSQSFSNR